MGGVGKRVKKKKKKGIEKKRHKSPWSFKNVRPCPNRGKN